MNARVRAAYVLLALLGLAASATSAVVHYRLLNDPGYTSFCDVNATVSCTEAYLSPWGSLLGAPVAVLGVIWFAVVLALLLAERVAPREAADGVPGYLLAWSAIGLAFVAYMAYGAFAVLGAVCLLCVTTYVAVIALFALSLATSRVPMSTLPGRAFRDLRLALSSPIAVVTLLLIAAGAATALASFPRHAAPAAGPAGGSQAAAAPAAGLPDAQRAEVEQWFDAQPRAIVPVDPEGAAVLIVKFNDFQCPPCGSTHQEYKPIIARYMAQYPGKIKYVMKDYPLDPECNAGAPRGGHQMACEAAVAARMAREKGAAQGDRLEDWLYANQQTLTREGVAGQLRAVAGVTDFDARYAKYVEQVKADTGMGGLLGIRSTPTFFINGVRIEGGMQPPFFDAILAHELKKAAR
jgi:uncharacterized membrane protein/protein-disulfide isomerase